MKFDSMIRGSDLIHGVTTVPWSQKGTVLVGGCFDIIHYGHLRFLQAARQQGERLVVALESDEFITNRKHRDAFHTQQQRAEVLLHLKSVDTVLLLPFLETQEEYRRLTEAVMPEIIAITQGDPGRTMKEDIAQQCGARVVAVTELLEGFSSSQIIKNANLLYD